ncbi:putative nonsense-mediated mRNA decay protein [Gaertneriomyces semiglobifer]|nr:putative nonsense-mediated mRNA decay protein [Gaertneriomyces semiglobifer]
MDATKLYQLFGATVHADPNLRMQAELELKKAEIADGFLPSLLQLITSVGDADSAVRQAGAIYFKNRVERGWSSSVKQNPINDQDKQAVRQHIIKTLSILPSNVRSQLVACLNIILKADYAEGRWPQYLPETMELVQAGDIKLVHAGLSAVREFASTFRWASEEKRQPLEDLIQKCLPALHAVATKLAPQTDFEAGEMLKSILKTYHATVRTTLSDAQQQTASLVPWGTLFVQVVEKTIPLDAPGMPEDPTEREKHPWWKAKKWAYACLNTLFTRYGRRPAEKYKQFSAVFMQHFAPNILSAYLKQVELLIAGVWMTSRVKVALANFLQECVKPKATWDIIQPHLEPIVLHFIFPLLSFNEDDAQLWSEDPVEYVQKSIESSLDEFRNPLNAAEYLLFDLAKCRAKEAFIPIVTLINSILTKYQTSPPDQQNPREKDGALRMMSSLAPLALSKKSPIKDQVQTFIVSHVLPELRSPHAFLRVRACMTLKSYDEVTFDDPSHLQFAFQGVVECLHDSELPVKVAAALAIEPYLKIEQIHEALKPHVQGIIQALLTVTHEIDLESLTQVIESLVADFADQLQPFAVELASQLRDSFMRLMEDISTETDSSEYNDALEEKMATAQGLMRTLCTLVLAMEASVQILAELETVVIPALVFVLEKRVLDLYQEAFEICETITFCRKQVSPIMWNLWPYIYSAFKADAYDYIDEMSNTLDNYVSFGKDLFANNEEVKAQVYDIIETVLKPGEIRVSSTNRSRACDLVEAVLLNLRGHVDSYIPRIVDLALAHLAKGAKGFKRPAFKVRCIEIIVNALFYNPSGTLAVLEERGATTAVFELWFTSLDDFRRVHDKKLSILALLAILQLPVAQIPTSLHGQGWTNLISGIVKVFETYPIAEKARADEKAAYENDTGDDDEDFDSDEDDIIENDGDVLDEEDQYLEMLVNKAAESRPTNGVWEEDGNEDDDDDDDDWDVDELEEDIFYETPLDEVDPYREFALTVQALLTRPDTSSIMRQAVTPDDQAAIERIIATERKQPSA